MMNDKDMIDYFDSNLVKIISNDKDSFLQVLFDLTSDEKMLQQIRCWPDEIKIIIVKKYLNIN